MRQHFGRRPTCCAAVVLATALLTGCAIFPNITLSTLPELKPHAAAHPVAPQEAIQLEIFFVERPPDDPLLGDALWRELDQIANLAPDVRSRLRQNGLRFGLAGTQPPYALSALMNSPADAGQGRRTLRQEYQMPSGVSHLFPCGQLPNPVAVTIDNDGSLRERSYSNARGVVRCRVERSQPGWARIEVLPEIHHGQFRMRPHATDEDWDWGGGQEVDSLYGQRFTVELNEGESLVLGAIGEQAQSIGSRLFRTSPQGTPIDKLLVIRLSRIDHVQPVLQAYR